MEKQELVKRYEAGERDFVEFKLLGAVLSGANLSNINLGSANLGVANLSRVDLSGANLGGDADLEAAIVTDGQDNLPKPGRSKVQSCPMAQNYTDFELANLIKQRRTKKD